ncbi:hypothetical protein SLEP1_g51555 [Rubroshorea leprosula]|uniref:Uncharacterized protein n=1 Tax=Rubroshorea leprosula TaxID=152421 RepID=A0AAV5M3J3_9ROSI|nr:hypothetical protein SLEP1_g51555 [Rubroshorea leprosula]
MKNGDCQSHCGSLDKPPEASQRPHFASHAFLFLLHPFLPPFSNQG